MKQVLFVIHLDKFTEGIYEFITLRFTEQDNWFLIYGPAHEFDFKADPEKCFWCDSYHNLDAKHPAVRIAKQCDAIVYSGIFGCEKSALKFGLNTIKKSYYQLWGGDFYCFRKPEHETFHINRELLFRKYVLKNAKAVINLIPGDYEALQSLCPTKAAHFVAPVTDGGKNFKLIQQLRNTEKCSDPVIIQIGNSATEMNRHIETLDLISKYKDENLQIVCPLSYGDQAYAEKVTQYGTSIFHEKFKAIRDYMDMEVYFGLIAKETVSIFNNNRQQAMGNINAALGLGNRVYISNSTPMWENYQQEGYSIKAVETISEMSFADFIAISDEEAEQNYQCYDRLYSENCGVKEWSKVFASI